MQKLINKMFNLILEFNPVKLNFDDLHSIPTDTKFLIIDIRDDFLFYGKIQKQYETNYSSKSIPKETIELNCIVAGSFSYNDINHFKIYQMNTDAEKQFDNITLLMILLDCWKEYFDNSNNPYKYTGITNSINFDKQLDMVEIIEFMLFDHFDYFHLTDNYEEFSKYIRLTTPIIKRIYFAWDKVNK